MNTNCRYIDSSGKIKREANSIIFRNSEDDKMNILVETTKEIYFLSEVELNSSFLNFVGKNGLTLHFFDYYGNYTGSFYPREKYLSGRITVNQVKAFEEKRMEFAKNIVNGIGENIREVVSKYDRSEKVKELIDYIDDDMKYSIDEAQDIKELLFVEGGIWNRFYITFDQILNKDFEFEKRTKRPPKNPLNALISFGNSILYSKCVSQIYLSHLNPTISFLHEPMERRFSLSLDLSEVFKPVIVFKTIINLVNKRMIDVNKHFDNELNYCILNKEGKRIYIKALEERLKETYLHPKLKRNVTYLNSIKLDAYKLIKAIVEEQEFIPFSLKNKY
ncbi:type I-B CRISPR-associated endonuclease Cas1b [Peptostreptococcaceae bacterium AGR-M142]